MKTLKWFSLEWSDYHRSLILYKQEFDYFLVYSEQQAFDWLEANGYIERIKDVAH